MVLRPGVLFPRLPLSDHPWRVLRGSTPPPFILVRSSSAQREGFPLVARRRQTMLHISLMLFCRAGASAVALTPKRNGPLVLRLVFTPSMPLITEMGRPPWRSPGAGFWRHPASREAGMRRSLVGVHREASSGGTLRSWSCEGAESLARCPPDRCVDVARSETLTVGTGDPDSHSPCRGATPE